MKKLCLSVLVGLLSVGIMLGETPFTACFCSEAVKPIVGSVVQDPIGKIVLNTAATKVCTQKLDPIINSYANPANAEKIGKNPRILCSNFADQVAKAIPSAPGISSLLDKLGVSQGDVANIFAGDPVKPLLEGACSLGLQRVLFDNEFMKGHPNCRLNFAGAAIMNKSLKLSNCMCSRLIPGTDFKSMMKRVACTSGIITVLADTIKDGKKVRFTRETFTDKVRDYMRNRLGIGDSDMEVVEAVIQAIGDSCSECFKQAKAEPVKTPELDALLPDFDTL
jgi:hypothetical protein